MKVWFFVSNLYLRYLSHHSITASIEVASWYTDKIIKALYFFSKPSSAKNEKWIACNVWWIANIKTPWCAPKSETSSTTSARENPANKRGTKTDNALFSTKDFSIFLVLLTMVIVRWYLIKSMEPMKQKGITLRRRHWIGEVDLSEDSFRLRKSQMPLTGVIDFWKT